MGDNPGSSLAYEDTAAATAVGTAEKSCEDLMFRSSKDVRNSYVTGIQAFTIKPVEYSVIDDLAFFEGDIMLGTAAELDRIRYEMEGVPRDRMSVSGNASADAQIAHGIGITGQRYRWPGGLVPYTTVASLRDRVRAALAHWEQHTRIRFVERTAANADRYPNFVSFEVRDGCWSSVGMQGGQQVISLAAGCGFGAAVHEVGHAVGLWHEQSREDRARNVRILWENIQAGQEHNFNQHIVDGDDIGAYDFGSLMHYGPTAFGIDGRTTIETLHGETIGQRNGLSAGDIAAVRALYPQLEPSRSWSATQFTTTVAANSTARLFTHSWPAYWFVAWTCVPTAPPVDGPAQIEWHVQLTRQTDRLLKYFVEIRNLQSYPVTVEARYDVLGWSDRWA
ncbi:M12 family metallopeptidase [Nocardia wallacei]|uniref:M12 family metallopeptidase n=1 Tax=Nocardia wallacei TaxID=480035 RepID=UPI00245666A3|nr:M12 family metallopeptidase [Nocardia wallacei]